MKSRRELLENIYWDYNVDFEVLSALVESPQTADQMELRKLFARAFEHLRWNDLVALFGTETVHKMGNGETRKLIRKEFRKRFDTAYAILRKEPLPITREDVENHRRILKPLLSDRWNRIE